MGLLSVREEEREALERDRQIDALQLDVLGRAQGARWRVLSELLPNVNGRIAETRQVPMAQVALAWVFRHPAMSAPIVGATKPHHLAEAVAALDLRISDEEAAALEAPYTHHGPSWY